jgi:hypothetical protein
MNLSNDLLSYITELHRMVSPRMRLTAKGYAYDSPYDFLLQHGRWYTPAALPPDIPRGAPKSCFGNAIVAAILYDLTYVEGYASLNIGQGAIPFEHAWCTDASRRVYEVTWPEIGMAYYGVEFGVERADDCTWNGDATVLQDHRRHYPLLRAPWTGEPIGLTWPESPRLAVLYDIKAQRCVQNP